MAASLRKGIAAVQLSLFDATRLRTSALVETLGQTADAVEDSDSIAVLMARSPSAVAQRRVLAYLRARLEPVRASEGLTADYQVEPGLRLRRTYGRCTWRPTSKALLIQVRCTADNDPARWRRVGAITGTLLHEMAHLRYRSHGPRFWALYRRLVHQADASGLYDPTDRDPAERPRGERKLGTRYARSSADKPV